uniref:Uncharacterized protein n=1 Tax=Corethron hystrix TaxID=216773 RepID=A0A7S1BEC6_9STRA|mmetsp:Transcript_24392/g.55686  ORF Transcript_24392/g.55686 Transcript_24392/m.55686 type:complete len:251 (+) Transcript_24392:397-1149(+)
MPLDDADFDCNLEFGTYSSSFSCDFSNRKLMSLQQTSSYGQSECLTNTSSENDGVGCINPGNIIYGTSQSYASTYTQKPDLESNYNSHSSYFLSSSDDKNDLTRSHTDSTKNKIDLQKCSDHDEKISTKVSNWDEKCSREGSESQMSSSTSPNISISEVTGTLTDISPTASLQISYPNSEGSLEYTMSERLSFSLSSSLPSERYYHNGRTGKMVGCINKHIFEESVETNSSCIGSENSSHHGFSDNSYHH